MNAKQSTTTPRRAEPTKASDTGDARRQIGEYSMDYLYSEAKRLISDYEAIALTGSLTTRQLLHHMQLCQFVHAYQTLLCRATACVDAAAADREGAA